jgi:polyisoprenoid-binding protein YceI
MKKNLFMGAGIVLIVLVVLFFALKPKAPEFGSIAVVTQDDSAVLALPQLGENVRRYMLESNSQMTWTGRKIGWYHDGTVNLSQGAFVIDDAWTAAGKFIIDMKTIAITDIEPSNPMYNQLLNHLRDGFFSVDQYPTVEFDLKKATKKSADMYEIVGDLKLKWVSREITFPAQVAITEDSMTAKANFFVDRTQWGIDEVIQIADKYIEFGVNFVFERL